MVAQIPLGPLGGGKDLDNDVGQSDHVAVFVEAVVVADGPAPGKAIQRVAEPVGVLVVVGLPQTLGGDVDVVVSRTLEPGQ